MSLAELTGKLEQATGPDRGLDDLIWLEVDRVLQRKGQSVPPYTSSVDAALTLIPEGWRIFDVEQFEDRVWNVCLDRGPDSRRTYGYARTFALALCIAALKAQETDQ